MNQIDNERNKWETQLLYSNVATHSRNSIEMVANREKMRETHKKIYNPVVISFLKENYFMPHQVQFALGL